MTPTTHIAAMTAALALTATVSSAQNESKPGKPAETAQHEDAGHAKKAAQGVMHPNAESATPLKAGDALPAIGARTSSSGQTVDLAAATAGKKAIIVFYRGGWCPYCNTHLADLARIQPQLAANGVEVFALSPESAETIGGYAAERKLPYTLLSDSDYAAAKAFGVAFAVDAAMQTKLKGYGIDLEKASGNPEASLPVPSLFVIGTDGKIAFAHANANYSERLSGEEVLKAAGITSAE